MENDNKRKRIKGVIKYNSSKLLNLPRSKLNQIPTNVFENQYDFTRMIFHFNSISNIDGLIVYLIASHGKGLSSNLTNIDLSNNRITNIDSLALVLHLTDVHILNLAHNSIANVSSLRSRVHPDYANDAPRPPRNLDLNISYNAITDITPLLDVTTLNRHHFLGKLNASHNLIQNSNDLLRIIGNDSKSEQMTLATLSLHDNEFNSRDLFEICKRYMYSTTLFDFRILSNRNCYISMSDPINGNTLSNTTTSMYSSGIKRELLNEREEQKRFITGTLVLRKLELPDELVKFITRYLGVTNKFHDEHMKPFLNNVKRAIKGMS